MEINVFLTEGPTGEEIKLKRNSRAVYDAEGRILCAWTKKRLYDLNGEQIAEFVREENEPPQTESGDWRTVRYYEGGGRVFSSDGEYLYLNAEKIGRIAEKERGRAFAAAMVAAACALISLSVILTALLGFPQPTEEIYPVLTIEDVGGAWGAEKEIDLFGGERLSPGAKGEYKFEIENPNDVRLQYDISLSFGYEIEGYTLPMRYALKMNNAEIQLTENQTGCGVTRLVFAAQSRQTFTLCWEWPFESGNDVGDTLIGADGGIYSCTVTITAQVA